MRHGHGHGLALAACLLVACIGAVAEAAGRWGGVDDFDLPAGMKLEPLGDGLRINGVDTRAWQFRSSEDADALAAHFSEAWDGRIARHEVGGWDILSHRQGDWLVTVQSAPTAASGGCKGFVSAAKLFDARRSGTDRLRPAVPKLPRTELLQDIEADDRGRGSRTLILLSQQSASQNLDFYRAHYRAEGFVPTTAGALVRSSGGGAMSLNRGSEQLNIAVSEHEGQSLIAIVRVRP